MIDNSILNNELTYSHRISVAKGFYNTPYYVEELQQLCAGNVLVTPDFC